MQGHQGIQPNAQHHEHDHHAQDLAKLAPIHALDVERRQQAAGEKAHRVEDGHRRFQAQQRRAHRHGEDVPCESRDGLDRVCEKERGQEKRFFHICYNPYLCDQPTSVARGAHHKTTHTPEDGIAWRDSPSPSQETRRSTWNSPMRYPRRRAPRSAWPQTTLPQIPFGASPSWCPRSARLWCITTPWSSRSTSCPRSCAPSCATWARPTSASARSCPSPCATGASSAPTWRTWRNWQAFPKTK